MVDQHGGQDDLDDHSGMPAALGYHSNKTAFQQLEGADKEKDDLLVGLAHRRQQGQGQQKQQPQKIKKPSRSGAFLAGHVLR